MRAIRNWLELKLYNFLKPTQCQYCHGKLKYFKYEAKINIDKLKKPPVGAVDQNIIITKTIKYTKVYVKCTNCMATYILDLNRDKYCTPGWRREAICNRDLYRLLAITDINKYFEEKISHIKDKNRYSDVVNITTIIKETAE